MTQNYLKLTITSVFCFFAALTFGQSTTWNNPDSAKNVSKPGVPWAITNPIGQNHDTMIHTAYNAAFSDSTDFLYMYDFGLNVPANATIEGVEVILTRGACNAGSYFFDTIQLADGTPIGIYNTDSSGPATAVDTFGAANDTWYNTLTPAMVNSVSFGVYYSARSVGICTFGMFNCQMRVYYTLPTGVKEVATSDRMKVYPNPSSTEITVDTRGIQKGAPYVVTDVTGNIVLNGMVAAEKTKINIATLPQGMYYFTSQGTAAKFMKQ